MKKTQIVSHIMPHEIEQFERVSKQLEKSYHFLDKDDYVELYYTFNLSPSLLECDKDFFIEKFNSIMSKYNSWCKSTTNIIMDDSILGTTGQKRKAIQNTELHIDQFIFLDCDIYFHETTLKYLIDASNIIDNEYYIVTPQTVKLWDETWDILTHWRFKNESYGFHKVFDPNSVLTQSVDDVNVSLLQNFKFGCGWFTLYSSNLWKYVGIPDLLGDYGSEDTFLMIASILMKEKGYDIQQYVLEGLYIAEDYMYRPNSYKEKIKYNFDKNSMYIKHDTPQFNQAIQELKTKI